MVSVQDEFWNHSFRFKFLAQFLMRPKSIFVSFDPINLVSLDVLDPSCLVRYKVSFGIIFSMVSVPSSWPDFLGHSVGSLKFANQLL